MDAVVFDESPMANYLEGQGIGNEMEQNSERSVSVSSDRPEFAPRGLARLRRSLLPPPLKIRTTSHPQSRSRSRSPTKATAPAAHKLPGEDEQFLEQFRYIIVASQLLTDQISSVHHRRLRRAKSESEPDRSPHTASYSVEGAVVAGTVPILLAFVGQWMVRRAFTKDVSGWLVLAQTFLLIATITVAAYMYSRRKLVKEIRRSTIGSLTNLVTSSHALDKSVTSALNFIQEVEIVSRGYDITTPLPPISRIEERTQQRRCLKLRHGLTICLNELCQQYVEVHHALTPYAAQEVVEQYHDIYDVSRRDYQEVGLLSPQMVPDDHESLKNLKVAFAKQFVSRKVVLCDILAFSTNDGEADLKKWHVAIEEMQRLTNCMSNVTMKLKDLLETELGPDLPQSVQAGDQEESTDPSFTTPARRPSEEGEEPNGNRAQIARINALSQSIRTLNAKMHLFKEQLDEAQTSRSPAETTAILIHQYDSAGVDLKSLLSEWERGKQLMTLQTSTHKRSSSQRFPRSPMSPTQSLSGSTAVDSSPSDAMRALNGDNAYDSDRPPLDHDHTSGGSDDEVFEAMSLPKPRPASNMSREEKIVKMREERLKRALTQEKQDANTHMLRELETVIKHRPRGRTSTRITTF